MKKMTRKLALAMALTLAATSMTACSTANTGSGVAKYGAEEIPMGEPEFLLRYNQWMSEAYYWDIYTYLGYENMWASPNPDGTATYGDTVHDDIMSQVLQTRVLMDHASEYGIEALDADQQAKVESMVDEFLAAYPKFTEHVSSTRDEMVSYMEKNAVASLVIEAVKEAANVEVADEEYQKYAVEYIKVSVPSEDEEEETEEAAEEEAPELQGMELAQEVLKRAEAGEDFEDIAAEYADATATSTSYMVTGETSTDTAYTASQNLAVGDVNFVEVNEDGWYIVKRVNDLDDEASESMRQSVISNKQSEAFNEVYAGWAASAQEFVVNEAKWAECSISEKIFEAETEEAVEEAESETAAE